MFFAFYTFLQAFAWYKEQNKENVGRGKVNHQTKQKYLVVGNKAQTGVLGFNGMFGGFWGCLENAQDSSSVPSSILCQLKSPYRAPMYTLLIIFRGY